MAQQREDFRESRGGESRGGGMAFMLIIGAIAFIGLPLILPAVFPRVHISGLAQTIMIGFGVLLLLAGSIMAAISQFYEKAGSNEAFVRTGMGGPVTVVDGGAIVIPAIHKIRRVSLETSKLVVERMGKDALITGDNLRADVRAEFYIRVNRDAKGVVAAATSLGDKSYNDRAIMDLVGEKLVSAMRTVAARSTLEHLHAKLDEYRDQVKQIVEHDLEPNGLLLETVAISHLNQTSPEHLDPENNVFDAQGLKKITEITQAQKIERSKITTEAEQTVKGQEVDRDKKLFTLGVDQAKALAATDLQTANAQAEARRQAAEFAAEQDQLSKVAQVTAAKAVEIANVEKQQAVQVAAARQEQEVQSAQIEKNKNIEVRTREQAITVAQKDKEKAQAEAERVAAETERAKKEQEKITVEKTAEAERSRTVAVIGKQAAAQQTQIERQMEADVAAYTVVAQAEGEQKAAEAQASAKLKLADADRQAAELRAAGDKAGQLVPVQVSLEAVGVKAREVEVERVSLENKEKFGKVSIELTVRLAEIQANRDARIEAAKAIGAAIAASDIKIFGDPMALQSILGSVYKAQAYGEFANALPTDVKELAVNTLAGFANLASAAVKKTLGSDISPEVIQRMVEAEIAARNGSGSGVEVARS